MTEQVIPASAAAPPTLDFDYKQIQRDMLVRRIGKIAFYANPIFAYFFLSCFFLINLVSVYFGTHSFLYKQFLIYGVGGLFLVTLISWYISAKRRIKMDAREAFAFVVLVVMKIVRVLTNIREADGVAKSIVLSPVYISKIGLNLVKYLGREFVGTFIDLGKAFGLKK